MNTKANADNILNVEHPPPPPEPDFEPDLPSSGVSGVPGSGSLGSDDELLF